MHDDAWLYRAATAARGHRIAVAAGAIADRRLSGSFSGPDAAHPDRDWTFTLKVGLRPVKKWSWAEFNALPQTSMSRDIHCVTKWSKFDTAWEGVLDR